ncbi:hypothetical protein VKT23_016006 [Stygiomarasmius scandens]|uniref:Uncharacterized protein n=1 Tax=Marasmiellus scandens TaxID=2682957 RepID=A0ABR1IXN9_9AGAR
MSLKEMYELSWKYAEAQKNEPGPDMDNCWSSSRRRRCRLERLDLVRMSHTMRKTTLMIHSLRRRRLRRRHTLSKPTFHFRKPRRGSNTRLCCSRRFSSLSSDENESDTDQSQPQIIQLPRLLFDEPISPPFVDQSFADLGSGIEYEHRDGDVPADEARRMPGSRLTRKRYCLPDFLCPESQYPTLYPLHYDPFEYVCF